jgi:hypothetical protein
MIKKKLSLFIRMVPRQCRLPLIQVLGIPFFEIRVFCPLRSVKDQLTDRHAGVDFYRAGVDVCHLEGDRAPEAGIDPASGLVEGDTKSGYAGFPLNRGNDVVGKLDALQCFGKHKLPGVEDERICMHFTHMGRDAVRIVGVDDLTALFVPDKMAAQPDINRVGLHQLRVVGFNPDIAPGNAVQELPVHENHWHTYGHSGVFMASTSGTQAYPLRDSFQAAWFRRIY